MHIMAEKGTCGRITHVWDVKPRKIVILSFCIRSPPGIMSAVSASILCNQDTSIAFKGLKQSKKGEREKRQI